MAMTERCLGAAIPRPPANTLLTKPDERIGTVETFILRRITSIEDLLC